MLKGPLVRHVSQIVFACFVLLGCIHAVLNVFTAVRPKAAAQADFIQFWATGHLLAARQSPYDLDKLMKIEQDAGMVHAYPRLSNSPPLLLPLFLPLGFVSAGLGFFVWFAAQLACLYCSAQLLNAMYGKQLGYLRWIVFLFGPVLLCERTGQLGVFFLMCLVLFLYLHRRHPFLAGVCLAPLALKPHLILPFGLVLLMWIILDRRWKILLGAVTVLACSAGLLFTLDPGAWQQYSALMRKMHLMDWAAPCLSVYLRRLTGAPAVVQFIPTMMAAGAAAVWYLRKRKEWEWQTDGAMLLALGLITAPYAWVMDEAIALPAILLAVTRCRSSWNWLACLALLNLVFMIEEMRGVGVLTPAYLWTAPAWFLWCFLASRTPSEIPDANLVLAAE
ncbi:glycosyltransferase family 87 protein [Occallatibacter riparius]|uniref:DUF2029 domain-containing protein n=1 Tax=Occallatibacter riparius TaxID=1002689 RepID=A0A9J7BX44_9BACT|nr:glycosyltransferase family 87 protein [Occallatibacter riparius]UWZ85653.1 DUF2029 domain-containing protein [Occallatibacter riparius]